MISLEPSVEPPSSPIPELERPRRSFRYKVDAIHVGVMRDAKSSHLTEKNLSEHGQKLGDKPLNIDHNEEINVEGLGLQKLPSLVFPFNRTEPDFRYNPETRALEGHIVVDELIDEWLRTGVLSDAVSVEKWGIDGYVGFKALSLLTKGRRGGDCNARIFLDSREEITPGLGLGKEITVNESSNDIHTSGEEVKIANSTSSNPNANEWMQRFSDLGITVDYLAEMDDPAKKNLIWAAAYKAKADMGRNWTRKLHYLELAAQHLTYALPGTKLKEMMSQEVT